MHNSEKEADCTVLHKNSILSLGITVNGEANNFQELDRAWQVYLRPCLWGRVRGRSRFWNQTENTCKMSWRGQNRVTLVRFPIAQVSSSILWSHYCGAWGAALNPKVLVLTQWSILAENNHAILSTTWELFLRKEHRENSEEGKEVMLESRGILRDAISSQSYPDKLEKQAIYWGILVSGEVSWYFLKIAFPNEHQEQRWMNRKAPGILIFILRAKKPH